jgi:hypothetical protein
MNSLSLILKIHGMICMVLAGSHFFFGRELQWKKDSEKLTSVNHDIFHVHTLFIVLILGMMGHLTFFETARLLERTALGYLIALYLCIFWMIRLYAQWCIFRRCLWQGKRRETCIHYLFTSIWIYFVYTGLMLLAYQW